MKRAYILTAVFLGLSLVLATSVLAAPKTTIVYWQFGGLLSERALMEDLVKEFNKQNPDIEVKYEHQEWGTRRQKIIASFQEGVAPDVFSMTADITELGERMGIVAPFKSVNPDAEKILKERIVPAALAANSYKGMIWMAPMYADMEPFLYYNTKMFEDAGLNPDDPPTTWNELVEYAKKLTRNGVYGFGFQASSRDTNGIWRVRDRVYQIGGRWFLEDEYSEKPLSKAIVNDKVNVSATQWVVDLLRKHKVVPPNVTDLSYMDLGGVFFAGKVAMWLYSSALPGIAADMGAPSDFPVRSAPAPLPEPERITGKYPVVNKIISTSTNLSIVSTSKHKDAAWKFIEFVTRPENLHAWVTKIKARVPVGIKSYEDPKMANDMKKVFPGFLKAYREGILFAGLYPRVQYAGSTEIEPRMMVAFQEALTGRKSVQQALDDAAKDVQKILDTLNKK